MSSVLLLCGAHNGCVLLCALLLRQRCPCIPYGFYEEALALDKITRCRLQEVQMSCVLSWWPVSVLGCCRAVAYWLGWSPETFYKMVSSRLSCEFITVTRRSKLLHQTRQQP
jgi:hypothetical protein